MPLLESAIENTVVDWAKRRNFLALKVKFVETGYPDRLFISPKGHTIFLEFKRPGEVPEPIQLYRIGQLREHGIPAFWTDNVIESISILSAALEPTRVPKPGDSTTVKSSVRGIISGSGPGQDIDRIGRVQDTSAQAVSQEDAYNRAATALLQSLAGRDTEMGKLLGPAMDYLARKGQGGQPTV